MGTGRQHKHRNLIISLSMLTIVLAGSQGCSVKEDRSYCPSLLIVNTEEISQSISPHVIHIWGDRGFHLYDKIIPEEYPHEWTAEVRRSVNSLTAVCGLDKTEIENRCVTIHRGQESDRLWAHHSLVDCSGEYGYDTLRLHKQYCVLTIDMLDYPEDATDWSEFPAIPEIQGSCSGYMLDEGSPLHGDFLANARYVGNGMFQIILPRQEPDDDLLMRVIQDGVSIGSVDIGVVLKMAGFDWQKEDLDDAFIIIRNSNSINIGGNGDGNMKVAAWQFGSFGTPGW